MKKYNSIAITLIVLGVLANSCASAFAESSEQFLEKEWNRTYKVGDIYEIQCFQKTSDGGYVTAKGSSLVKLGWIKTELSPTGIIQDETSRTRMEIQTQPYPLLKKLTGLRSFFQLR
jgi:hypothetical protein